jgi:hypothetical protein
MLTGRFEKTLQNRPNGSFSRKKMRYDEMINDLPVL